MKMSFRVVGGEALKGRTRAFKAAYKVKLRAGLVDLAGRVAEGARQRCPVSAISGNGTHMRDTIKVEDKGGMEVTVVVEAPYAEFVEFGTGHRGAATNQQTLPPGYVHGSIWGQAAQPFLYPAFRAEEGKAPSVASKALKESL